jgi:cytochrome c peroxidase
MMFPYFRLNGGTVGNRVVAHADEPQLGRFNVTLAPVDMALFCTPSLCDVSHATPYMHGSSARMLEKAIDREVYYRGPESRHPLRLTAQSQSIS